MSPIDKLFGESAIDRFFTLVMLLLAGMWFGAGFWLAHRCLV